MPRALSRRSRPGAYDDKRTRVVIADGTKFVAETDDRFDVILVDSTDPIGPGAVLFTNEFYTDVPPGADAGRRARHPERAAFPARSGAQADRLAISASCSSDAFAYIATTPSYFGGAMSYGWASDDKKLRQHSCKKIAKRYEKAGAFPTRYWRPEVQVAAFALPNYVRELVEA